MCLSGVEYTFTTHDSTMSRDGGNIVLFHPRVEYSTIFIYSVLALHTYYSPISTRLPEILDGSFQWGLQTPEFG